MKFAGDGEVIDVYLLPGMDGTGTLFGEFAQASPEWANPVIISYESALENSYSALGRFVGSRIDQSRKHIILGESFSGPIAISLAGENRANLAGVVLVASFTSYPFHFGRFSVPKAILNALIKAAPHKLLTAQLLLNGERNASLAEQVALCTRDVPSKVLADRFLQIQQVDVSKQMKAIRCPVLYLQGSRDRLVPNKAAYAIKSLNSLTEIQKLDAPHMVLQCQAKQSWKLIGQWLGLADKN